MPSSPMFAVSRKGGLVQWESWEHLSAFGEYKFEILDGQLGRAPEQTEALLGLLLQVVGVDRVLALTDPRVWREALDAFPSRGRQVEPGA